MNRLASPEPLLDLLRRASSVLITSHVSPDGDAVGSSVALARLCRQAGKTAQVWLHDPPPRLYRELSGFDAIHSGPTPPPGYPTAFDLAVLLECPTLERSGLEKAFTPLPVINIDHHLGNAFYGVACWVDPAAAAVGEMITRLASALGWPLDAEIANALLLALVTDTGGFRYSNAQPEAFEVAAELVRAGARPELVAQWLYESQPLAAVALVGEALRTLELHREGSVATLHLTREMLLRVGAGPGDTEGLIDYPRSISGVEAVAMFRETDDGVIKVSLRSRGEVDVERVAHQFGGGGHHNAAGFKSRQPYSILRSATLDALVKALDQASA